MYSKCAVNYPFRRGKRVYLRAYEPEDDEHSLRWFNDPLITQWLDAGAFPLSRQSQKERAERFRTNSEDLVLAVCKEENDLHIGNVGFHNISYTTRNAEIGVVIGERTLHGKGYGSEAIELMVKYGFESLNLRRIYLRVLMNNEAALKSYEKLGFQKEGVFREHAYKDGQYLDQVIMGLLRSE